MHMMPNPIACKRLWGDLKKAGAKAVAMEVSSHGSGLGARERVCRLTWELMTNLSRDNDLDYHGTMEAYAENIQAVRLE